MTNEEETKCDAAERGVDLTIAEGTISDLLKQRNEAREQCGEARENCKSIVDKANELIARWDQPSWKDTAPTARFINALRIAVRAYEDTP